MGRTYDIDCPGGRCRLPDRRARYRASARTTSRWRWLPRPYANGYVKNKVMEFVGPGVANLTADYRNGIDVMTTETTCLVLHLADRRYDTKEYFEHARPRGGL